MKGILCGAGLLLLAGVAGAQVSVVETYQHYAAEPATGYAHRADVGNATLALQKGDIAAARSPSDKASPTATPSAESPAATPR